MSSETVNDTAKKNVVKKQNSKPPANIASLIEADAGMGLENIGSEDVKIPFLRILQQMSPQVNPNKGEYIEGAKPGMIINSVSRKLYDGSKGINVLRCYYKREMVEWQDRGSGVGAPVNTFSADDPIIHTAKRDTMGKDRLPNGNYLANTANHFVLLLDENGVSESALIAMASSQLVKSREWNTMITSNKHTTSSGKIIKPPSFSHIYNLKSITQSNSKGEFFNWGISRVGPLTDVNVYAIAKSFAESVSKGSVNARYEEEKSEEIGDAPF